MYYEKDEKIGTIAIYLASFFWGSAFVAQKILVDAGIPPFYMVGLRMSFTIILILFILKKQMKLSTIKRSAMMGFVIFLVFSLQTYGLKTLDSSVSSFITSLNLVLIPIINRIFFRSIITIPNIVSIFIALVGVYFFNITDNFVFVLNIGMILTLMCAVMCAVQLVYNSHFLKDEDPIQFTTMQNLFCGVYAFIFAFFFEGGISGFPRNWDRSSLFSIIYLGLIASVSCFLLLAIGQKKVCNIVKVGLIMAMQPLFTTIMAVLLLGEQLTLFKIIGMFCIVFAIGIDEYSMMKQKQQADC